MAVENRRGAAARPQACSKPRGHFTTGAAKENAMRMRPALLALATAALATTALPAAAHDVDGGGKSPAIMLEFGASSLAIAVTGNRWGFKFGIVGDSDCEQYVGREDLPDTGKKGEPLFIEREFHGDAGAFGICLISTRTTTSQPSDVPPQTITETDTTALPTLGFDIVRYFDFRGDWKLQAGAGIYVESRLGSNPASRGALDVGAYYDGWRWLPVSFGVHSARGLYFGAGFRY